jgi:hypothetical protein
MARRKERMRRVLLALGALAVALGIVGYLGYRMTRPDLRRPGEDLPEITRKLALDLPEHAPLPEFVDVTEAAGLAEFVSFRGDRTSQLPEDMGAGAAWGDFDNDGDDDLFLVAAGGSLGMAREEWAESMLFENRGDGTFSRVRDFPTTRIMGMGAAWGDADGDGRLDLVVSGYQALILFRNLPDGFVRDVDFPSPPGYWAGVTWGDIDNDRDLDLYVSGYVDYEENDSASREATEQYGTSGSKTWRFSGASRIRVAEVYRRSGTTSTPTGDSICTSPTTSRITRCTSIAVERSKTRVSRRGWPTTAEPWA